MIQGQRDPLFLTSIQLQTEVLRCEYCETKPCQDACPVDCSPADFIMAARMREPSDIKRSAARIMSKNPLGGVCGMVCPDRFCMAACPHKTFDGSINIPIIQASVVDQAKQQGGIPPFRKTAPNGKKVAVVGGGPAGLAATAALAQMGYEVVVFEAREKLGGMCHLIPDYRLTRSVLETDIEFLLALGAIQVKTSTKIDDPKSLLGQGYSAVLVATGLWVPIKLGIPGEDRAIMSVDYLDRPDTMSFSGRVAVVGGGATAVDCAVTAKRRGARHVEMFALETLSEMPLTSKERTELLEHEVELSNRTKLTAIRAKNGSVTGIETRKVVLADGKKFALQDIKDLAGSDSAREDVTAVITAIGLRPVFKKEQADGLFYAGDGVNGPTTVVEAAANGKNTALEIDAAIRKADKPVFAKAVKSHHPLSGHVNVPVSLETDFFGRKIRSPFLLSAAPPTDGYEQMKMAYEAGWAGAVMKTAFNNVPIHIPAEYMHAFSGQTYGNCDNVSGHPLDRVCSEIERLVKEFPDRLTIGSTGGPVTGNEESDREGWQSNTKLLQSAGAMGIEYSLSCPQGGDGSEGDIVSQNAPLTAKIVDWILQVSDPEVPKLFKLTAAVTAIVPILRAIHEVLDRHPGKKAGVTLANTFPTLCFRPGQKKEWEEGIVVGMSGEGVAPISYLTLAMAAPVGVEISGNGGPMDYKAAMNFLALGVKTVQFCTIVMKYGYGIINDLESGTAYLMQARGIPSMKELIGRAQPNPVTDFMALTSTKRISHHDHELCVHCGNCGRCPYMAIHPDKEGNLMTEPAHCIGCSICAQKCFVGAITMRDRTAQELQLLQEA